MWLPRYLTSPAPAVRIRAVDGNSIDLNNGGWRACTCANERRLLGTVIGANTEEVSHSSIFSGQLTQELKPIFGTGQA
jgi:hypothetical protein